MVNSERSIFAGHSVVTRSVVEGWKLALETGQLELLPTILSL